MSCAAPALDGMSFRVHLVDPRHFTDDPVLRPTLDALLVNRLPDVELLTCGGRGVPMFAASYASEPGSPIARGMLPTSR